MWATISSVKQTVWPYGLLLSLFGKKTRTTHHSKKDATIKLTIMIWLVVSNMLFFPFHIWDVILPTENMFQDGDGTTNQIYNCHDFLMVFLLNHHFLTVHQVKQTLFRFKKPSEAHQGPHALPCRLALLRDDLRGCMDQCLGRLPCFFGGKPWENLYCLVYFGMTIRIFCGSQVIFCWMNLPCSLVKYLLETEREQVYAAALGSNPWFIIMRPIKIGIWAMLCRAFSA